MKQLKKVLLAFLISILVTNSTVYGFAPMDGGAVSNYMSEENALRILQTSKLQHNLGNYRYAIRGYDNILNSSSQRYIKSQALNYKALAKALRPISLKYEYHENFPELSDKARTDYKTKGYQVHLKNYYNSFDSYFDFDTVTYRESEDLSFDSNKIPMVKYNGKFCYNPATVAQYALSMYGRYINGNDTKKLFLDCADFLVSLIDEKGALKYDFTYNHYEDLAPGWTSSIAEGHALSVFERAFYITHDKKYLDAGNKALEYLITPVSKGGVLDSLEALDVNLKDKVFFQEYVNTTGSYTLNGYIFTLIGLYDWSQIENKDMKYYTDTASNYFNKGIESLKYILPYYDIGGFTSYDLYFITKKTDPNSAGWYHLVHIEQLDALYAITKDSYFQDIRDLWLSYVN